VRAEPRDPCADPWPAAPLGPCRDSAPARMKHGAQGVEEGEGKGTHTCTRTRISRCMETGGPHGLHAWMGTGWRSWEGPLGMEACMHGWAQDGGLGRGP